MSVSNGGRYAISGSTIEMTTTSGISLDFPIPGAINISSTPQISKSEISMEGKKISFPAGPGAKWEVEEGILTTSTPVFMDTWKKAEEIKVPETPIAKAMMGTWELVSRELPDGTILVPPKAAGVSIFTNRHFVISVADSTRKAVSGGNSGTYSVSGSTLLATMSSTVNVDDPSVPEGVIVSATPMPLDLPASIEGSKGYIVNMKEGKTVAFVGAAWTNMPPVSAAPLVVSIDSAWAFIVSGPIDKWDGQPCVVTVKNLRTGEYATDYVERDGYFSAVFADLTRRSVIQMDDEVEVSVRALKGDVIAEPVQKRITKEDIHQAFAKLSLTIGEVIPPETVLLQNYPNPFNPETWIPFKLSQPSDVTITIYDIAGIPIRVLHLGMRSAGNYISADKAAYWDGGNESGEQVSSGVYFYTLKAEDFSATRRMVILK